jgi:hypothetical protein
VTFTDRERAELERIERELAGDDPRLARLLRTPDRWYRLRWARRTGWLALLAAMAVVAAVGIGLALAV